MNDPCYDIGAVAPPNGIKVKDPMWYLKSNSSNVISTHGDVHQKCKIQASTIYPNAILCHNEIHTFQLVSIDLISIIPFMEIDDKGGEVGTKI